MTRIVMTASIIVLIAGASVRAEESAPRELRDRMEELNKAYVVADASTIKRLVTDDHLSIVAYSDKPMEMAEQLKSLADFGTIQFTPGTMTLTARTPDLVQISYTATLTGTFRGKPVPPKIYVSAFWIKRDGQWKEFFYQETALTGR